MDYQTLTPRGLRWVKNNWNNFNFEISRQRRGGLWSLKKKTMMVHTALAGYYTNPIFCTEPEPKKYEFIDGKQRMTTMKEFLDDEFALSEDILEAPYCEDIDLEELVGKKFSELDQKYQDIILDYNFRYIVMQNATEEEVEEQMYRLNQEEKMTVMEQTRIKCGEVMRTFLDEVSNSNFFKIIAFGKNDRKRFNDQLVALEMVAHLLGKEMDFSGVNLRKITFDYKKGLPQEIKDKIFTTMDYLYDAFKDNIRENKGYVPCLKKIHIIGIFANALEAIENEIEPENFGHMVIVFLKTQEELRKSHKKDNTVYIGRYNEACDSGSNKIDNINVRIDELGMFIGEMLEGMKEQDSKLEEEIELNLASGQ